MKKLNIFLVLALTSVPLFTQSFDIGLSLENTTTAVSSTDFSLNQANKAILWTSLEGAGLSFSAQGSFLWDYNSKTEVSNLVLDLDGAVIEGLFTTGSNLISSYSVQLGRIPAQDTSRLVLNQTLDGLFLTTVGNVFDFTLLAGYNGFLSKKAGTMVLTNSDITDQLDADVFFASPRLVAQTSIKFKVAPSHDLSFGYLYQQDLRKFLTPDRVVEVGEPLNLVDGGELNTHHISLRFVGVPTSGLVYDIAGVYYGAESLALVSSESNNYFSLPISAFAGSLGLAYYDPDGYFTVKSKGIYTSGDDKNRLDYKEGSDFSESPASSFLFKTLSNIPLGTVFSPQLGNLITGEASFSMKPFKDEVSDFARNFQITAKALTFFRGSDGPISVTDVNAAATDLYLGTEANLSFAFRPLSDLGVFLTSGFFFPNISDTGLFKDKKNWIESKVVLYLSMNM